MDSDYAWLGLTNVFDWRHAVSGKSLHSIYSVRMLPLVFASTDILVINDAECGTSMDLLASFLDYLIPPVVENTIDKVAECIH